MIYELATIEVSEGGNAGFEDGVRRAVPLFQQARGFRSVDLQRSIEHPQRYRLVVGWDTVEDHMVHFRESPAFQEWRALVGPFFATPPAVEHVEGVALG